MLNSYLVRCGQALGGASNTAGSRLNFQKLLSTSSPLNDRLSCSYIGGDPFCRFPSVPSPHLPSSNSFSICISMDGVNMNISKPRGPGRPRKPDAATTLVPVQLSKATAKDLDRWEIGRASCRERV